MEQSLPKLSEVLKFLTGSGYNNICVVDCNESKAYNYSKDELVKKITFNKPLTTSFDKTIRVLITI